MQRQTTIWTAEDDLLALSMSIVTLAPAQQKVADQLVHAVASENVCLLQAGHGMGKTTILRWLHGRLGGVFLAARQAVKFLNRRTVTDVSGIVFVDDLHLVTPEAEIGAALMSRATNKFVFAFNGQDARATLPNTGRTQALAKFKQQDYARICRRYLGEAAGRLDMAAIYRADPGLNGYQLKHACLWLGLRYAAPSTAAFLEYIEVGTLH